jgi:hypothetical protein
MGDNYMNAAGELINRGLYHTSPSPPSGVLIFDVETPVDRQVIHVDKRQYEIRYIGETESSVEISITRKVHSKNG